MGRTLFGIDLDESPFGGLVERLLDEEDLEKLDARPDGGTAADDPDGTDASDTDDGEPDGTHEAGPGDDPDDADATDVSRSPAWEGDDPDGAGAAETPDPGGIDDGRDPLGPGPAVKDGSGDDGGRLAALRSRLSPAVLAVAGLVVLVVAVALVAWRYGDRIRTALSDRLRRGSGDGDEAVERAVDGDSDGDVVGSARDGDESEGWSPETPETGSGDGDDVEDEDDDAGVGVPLEDDVGALVALAFLALVATLVRKATEERPRDPLVDADSGD